MTARPTGATATAQHEVSTAMGPKTQQSPQPCHRDAFNPSAPLPRAGGEQVGLPGRRRPASNHALPASLRADSACVFLLQASSCPLILQVPASCVCQVQGCTDAPLRSSWDLCDEPGSSIRYIPVHCLPKFLASIFCEGSITPCRATANHLFLAII